MPKPSKPIAKDSNSRYISRNNKQEIFTRIAKTAKSAKAKAETEAEKRAMDVSKPDTDKLDS